MSIRYRDLAKANKKWTKDKILKELAPVYEQPGRTKQSLKDDCDINKILQKFQETGAISHLAKYEPIYGDFAELPSDPFEAQVVIDRLDEVFQDLPSELRREFKQDKFAFAKYVNDPQNVGKLDKIFPELAKPGKHFPDVSAATPPDALLGERASEPLASVSSDSEAEPQVDAKASDTGSQPV